jgi:hypothetical protein
MVWRDLQSWWLLMPPGRPLAEGARIGAGEAARRQGGKMASTRGAEVNKVQ